MAREITDRDLEDLGDEAFERLIASLVRRVEGDRAEKLANPDGGADVLIPANGKERARVWQVKHYPRAISWSKCEQSLDEAVRSFDPAEVTFVFPRDLSAPARRTFQRRLVERHPDVDVRFWGFTTLQELLHEQPAISERYFGAHQEDNYSRVLRAIQQGGNPLDDTRDLADRAFALAAFADRADPNFECEHRYGNANLRDIQSLTPPFMVITETRGSEQVETRAFLRPEASADARFGFTDDEPGRDARERLCEAFARGEGVELEGGIWIRIENAPVVVEEAIKSLPAEARRPVTRLAPAPPQKLSFETESDEGPTGNTFELYALPPTAGALRSYGAISGALAVWIDLRQSSLSSIAVDLRVSLRRSEDASESAEAGRFLLHYYSSPQVTLRGADFVPGSSLVMSGSAKAALDPGELHQLEVYTEFNRSLAVIEAHVGRKLDVPSEIEPQSIEAVQGAAQLLRSTGDGMKLDQLVIELPIAQVEAFVAGAQRGEPGHLPFTIEPFGERIDLGFIEFPTPPVRFFSALRTADPTTARVVLHLDNSVSVPYRVVNNPPAEPVLSNLLWTPARGDGGLVARP
ncbi:MAG TPA: hypothetical protein VGO31_01495 [Microbacteriaceae bacterium]|jgi:hypothetical protein|nr:hypothetical protein [Microbacteriaceae bacterium]